MNGEILVEKLKAIDDKTFEEIYKQYYEKVKSYVTSKIGNDNNIEDLVQEVFIRVYKYLDSYDSSKGNFYNFILLNANNVIIDYVRKKKVRENRNSDCDIETIKDDDFDLEEIGEHAEEKQILKSIMDELPDTYKEIIELIYIKDLSNKAAANIMGKNVVSFKSTLYRARKELKKKLFEKYPEMRDTSMKHTLKIILVLISSVCLLSGLVYATITLYRNVFIGNKYTISELNEDIPEEMAIVSREDATKKINDYLVVLGHDGNVNQDDLHLIRDYQLRKICWTIKNEKYLMRIDAENNTLIDYTDLDLENSEINKEKFKEIYTKLELPTDYEVCESDKNGDVENIKLAKKYGDIYNYYESVTLAFIEGKLSSIVCNSYNYVDKEILISKEEAKNIFIENGVNADDIYLTIKEVDDFSYETGSNLIEEIDKGNFEITEIENLKPDIRKVWKTVVNDKIYFVDSNTGEFINGLTKSIRNKNS